LRQIRPLHICTFILQVAFNRKLSSPFYVWSTVFGNW